MNSLFDVVLVFGRPVVKRLPVNGVVSLNLRLNRDVTDRHLPKVLDTVGQANEAGIARERFSNIGSDVRQQRFQRASCPTLEFGKILREGLQRPGQAIGVALDNHITERSPDWFRGIDLIALLLQHLPKHFLVDIQHTIAVCHEVLPLKVVQFIQKPLVCRLGVQLTIGLKVCNLHNLVLLLVLQLDLLLDKLISCGKFRNFRVNERIIFGLVGAENRVEKLLLIGDRCICEKVRRFQEVWVLHGELRQFRNSQGCTGLQCVHGACDIGHAAFNVAQPIDYGGKVPNVNRLGPVNIEVLQFLLKFLKGHAVFTRRNIVINLQDLADREIADLVIEFVLQQILCVLNSPLNIIVQSRGVFVNTERCADIEL